MVNRKKGKKEEKKEGIEKKVKEAKEEELEEKVFEKHSRQTKIIVIIMIVLLSSVFLAHWFVQKSKTFEYNGIKFYKEKEGTIMFYKSTLGYATLSGESIPFVIKLRTDPRELDKILIEGQVKNLRKEAFLSLSPEVTTCNNTLRTMVDFSLTLGAFGIKTSAATTDEGYAKENNLPLITCKDAKQQTVIVMKGADESKIVKTGECYTLEIENCEIQEIFESFLLDLITNSLRH